jgi:hypothetical protein
MFTTKYSKNRNNYAGKSKKKGLKFEDGGAVPYPRADDNLFMASGPDEKIIRAKRAMRYYMDEDKKSRTENLPGINTYLAQERARDTSDDLRGKKRRWRDD